MAEGSSLSPTMPDVRTAIMAHLSDLSKPGVCSVRPGWEFTGGWLTGRRAIVATVDKKRTKVASGDRLPDEVAGVPVDVLSEGSGRTRSIHAQFL